METFTQRVREQAGLRDLVVLVVLKEDAKEKLAKMVGEGRLPVLQDTPEVDFRQTFGVSGARSFFVFDRQGCLTDCDVAVTPDEPGQLDSLIAPLQRAAG